MRTDKQFGAGSSQRERHIGAIADEHKISRSEVCDVPLDVYARFVLQKLVRRRHTWDYVCVAHVGSRVRGIGGGSFGRHFGDLGALAW